LHPAATAFVRAAAELGLPARESYCNGDLNGAFIALATVRDGLRSSTRVAHIDVAKRRRNVEVVTHSWAEKILFNGRRAVGVRVQRDGTVIEYTAQKEIIVSCGAIQSPLILMRSGLGPADELKALNIRPLHDLPGVGRNLQDHIGTGSARRLRIPSYNVQAGAIDMASHIARFILFRRGPLTSAAAQALAYFKTDPALSEPDFALTFVPLLIDYNAKPPKLLDVPGVVLGAVLCKPYARGSIRLRDVLTASKPIINFPMLADRRDLQRLIIGLKTAERMWDTRALASLVAGHLAPTPADDTEWESYLRATCGIGYHAAGTCRMGQDADAVVDPQLRVRGIEGVRVIDASIMPRIVSGNINAAVIMIGEKGADLVRRNAGP
jgi:choline dehydrogenase